jgi:hypothetical protein
VRYYCYACGTEAERRPRRHLGGSVASQRCERCDAAMEPLGTLAEAARDVAPPTVSAGAATGLAKELLA